MNVNSFAETKNYNSRNAFKFLSFSFPFAEMDFIAIALESSTGLCALQPLVNVKVVVSCTIFQMRNTFHYLFEYNQLHHHHHVTITMSFTDCNIFNSNLLYIISGNVDDSSRRTKEVSKAADKKYLKNGKIVILISS